MGYSFSFGRVVVDRDEKTGGFTLAVESPGPDPEVHSDEWEMQNSIGDPTRSPSYSGWHKCLEELPSLDRALRSGQKWGASFEEWVGEPGRASPIPCSVFVPFLEAVESESMAASVEAGARGLWFVRWCRRTIELYGDYAVFERPGEW